MKKLSNLKNRINRFGYSLAEVLLVVAILIIVFAIGVPGLIAIQKNLRQTELDRKAETIYNAVQNRLSSLYASGKYDLYDPSTYSANSQSDQLVELTEIPGDYDDTYGETLNDATHVYYFLSGSQVADEILEEETLSEDLMDGHFVIEIIPYSYRESAGEAKQITAATVYAVYYSEDVIDVTADDQYPQSSGTNSNYLNKYRRGAQIRKSETDARVGYYGGSNPGSGSSTSSLAVTKIEITSDKEVNEGIVKVRKPLAVDAPMVVTFELQDAYGNTRKFGFDEASKRFIAYTKDGQQQSITSSEWGLSYRKSGMNYTFTITIDDLTSAATRFDALWGSSVDSQKYQRLIPGADLKLTATAECPTDYTVTGNTVSAYGNSLFAYTDKSSASSASVLSTSSSTGFKQSNNFYITNGRHLQNLDDGSGQVSGYNNQNTTAAILNDISFKEDSDFYEEYSDGYYNGLTQRTQINATGTTSIVNVPNFEGITNAYLTNVYGKQSDDSNVKIYNLTVNSNGDAGLISQAGYNLTIDGLTMLGTQVTSTSATGSAGGLVGKVTSYTKITNCAVYLSTVNGDIPSAILSDYNTEAIRWIKGYYAGGLVGSTDDWKQVEITNSFASTVIGQTGGTTGGLIGKNAGNLTINNAYADSYLYGYNVGGLVGSGNSGNINIYGAYASGFIGLDKNDNASGAGLVNGSISQTNDVYTIVSFKNVADDGGIDRDAETRTGNYYSTASSIGYGTYTYYLHGAENKGSDLSSTSVPSNTTAKAMFSDDWDNSFTSSGNTITSYKLMGQSLTAYQYPTLTGVPHYGDWDVSFQPGSLVYYEEYDNGASYGFDGAGVDISVTTAGVITGDGYGVIFNSEQSNTITVTIKNGSTSSTYNYDPSQLECVTTTVKGVKYYIYKLPKALINSAPLSNQSYYTMVTLSSDGGNNEKYYTYNPHFARSAREATSEAAAEAAMKDLPEEIYIRSPRHLYNLSKWYDSFYREKAGSSVVYTQQRDMDYKTYNWPSYTNESGVTSQAPIGQSEAASFNATYNGSCYKIGNISFITESGSGVGMFGYTKGTIRNVVITTDYSAGSSNVVKRNASVTSGQTLYTGILAGKNDGTIDNCAVAGYYLTGSDGTIRGYQDSKIYVGGLVGYNTSTGRITNSSADSPKLSLNMYNATCYAGGLVGYNEGTIRDAYALNHIISTVTGNSGRTNIAGFAGNNTGNITNSYCATALTSSGTQSYSYLFTPGNTGGYVSNSYYLYKGSYTFVDGVYSYDGDTSATDGTYKTYNQLKNLAGSATAVYSYNHTKTTETNYPYRAVVKNSNQQYVHYGDWQVSPQLGTYGVFYWEKEEYGQNNGYKITYIGKSDGNLQYQSTLCEEHDDSGVITEYGYGVYVLEGESVNVTTEGLATSGMFGTSPSNYDATASASFAEQFPGLTFYPYVTTTDTSGSYIKLDNSNTDINGKITLTYKSDSTSFYISPFFGNALSMKVDSTSGISEEAKPFFTTSNSYGRNSLTDGIPGHSSNYYEIRSADQLQYINWNYQEGNATSLVGTGNYNAFNYLLSTNSTGYASQTLNNAGNSSNNNLYFVMSHDLKAKWTDASGVTHGIENYVPIAGQSTSSDSTQNSITYDAVLYGWFGSHFDGQSYKIQELNINSSSFTVGLFGVTVDADIKNTILYSEEGATIQRTSTNADSDAGAYSLGGLVGVAYGYGQPGSATGQTITNCAIAGYNIVDNSKNRLTLGEANVGGLIGVSNVPLENCTSVVDIAINCTHELNGKFTRATYGNFIRVGGIAGAVQGKVNNSYSGGSITVGAQTLLENYGSSNPNYSSYITSGSVDSQWSTNIYIAGIAGSGFTMNYKNFTNSSKVIDGNPDVENSYTYMNFPALEGSVRSITMITSVADRYNQNNQITGKTVSATIQNCYYLGTSAVIDVTNAPKFKLGSSSTVYDLSQNSTNFNNMINGSTHWEAAIYGKSQWNQLTGTPTSVTYGDLSDTTTMSNKLGSGWAKVQTEDNGVTVEGKYSFPTGVSSLQGKAYPFPTIILQDSTIHVHYGRWPFEGAYFSKAMDTMDIFNDMDMSDETAYKEFTLNANGSTINNLQFEITNDGSADQDVVQLVMNEDGTAYTKDDNGNYIIKLKALKTGTVEVKASYTNASGEQMTASFTLSVTANLSVSADPDEFVLGNGDSSNSSLSATSADGTKTLTSSKNIKWESTPTKLDNEEDSVDVTNEKTSKITLTGTGNNGVVSVKATYTYNGNEYSGLTTISVKRTGAIGVASRTSGNAYAYSETSIHTTTSGKTYEGEETIYSSEASPENTTNDYYFYVYDDSSNILKIALENKTMKVTATDEEGKAIDVAMNIEDFNKQTQDTRGFTSVPFTVTYKDNNATESKFVNLKMEIPDEATGNTYVFELANVNATAEPYTITTIATKDTVFASNSTNIVVYNRTQDYAIADFEKPSSAPTGYDFAGWSTTETGEVTDKTSYPSSENEDITLYSVWSPKTEVVTVNYPDKTQYGPSSLTLTYDATLNYEAPTIPGFAYEGLYADSTYTTCLIDGNGNVQDGAQTLINNMITNDTADTLYVKYTRNAWTVTLYRVTSSETNEDGTPKHATLESTVRVDASTTSVARPTTVVDNNTYTLEGWYTSIDGNGTEVLDKDGNVLTTFSPELDPDNDGTINLYARWTRVETTNAYVLTNSLSSNGKYLIANTNEAGDAYIMLAESKDTTSLKSSKASVKTYGSTTYITTSDVGDTAIWQYGKAANQRESRLWNSTNGTTQYAYCESTNLRLSTYYGDNRAYQWNYSDYVLTTTKPADFGHWGDRTRYLSFVSSSESYTLDSSLKQNYIYLYKYTEGVKVENSTFVYDSTKVQSDEVEETTNSVSNDATPAASTPVATSVPETTATPSVTEAPVESVAPVETTTPEAEDNVEEVENEEENNE